MLNRRLSSAAELVRQGAHFADVGTDHAYLPLFLLASGRIADAICTDVNSGPLQIAKRNAEQAGLYDRIRFILTDGARELSGLGITDMAICGMGGELISSIIDAAPYLKSEGIRLILQPMSRRGHLLRYLFAEGFCVVDEKYSFDAGKYYYCFAAEYTGVRKEITEFEAEFGKVPPRAEITPEQLGYLEGKARALYSKICAMDSGGHDVCTELALYRELCAAIGRNPEFS